VRERYGVPAAVLGGVVGYLLVVGMAVVFLRSVAESLGFL
jgi:hypothetical protein